MPGEYGVKHPDGGWGPFPDEIITECEGADRVYHVVPTSTATPEQAGQEFYTLTLNIDAEPRDDCEPASASCELIILSPEDQARLRTPQCGRPDRSLASCVVGSWRADVETYKEEMLRLLPARAHFVEARNGSRMAISDDGVVETCVDLFSHIAIRAANVEIHTETRVKGTAIQKVESVSPDRLCTVSIRDGTSYDFRSWIGDPSNALGAPGGGSANPGSFIEGYSRFECDASTLTLHTEAPGVGEIRSLWHRVD